MLNEGGFFRYLWALSLRCLPA